MADVEAHGARVRRRGEDLAAGRVGGQRQAHVDVGVVGEDADAVRQDRGALGVEGETALAGAAQLRHEAVRVTQEEVVGSHDELAPFSRGVGMELEAGDHALRERLPRRRPNGGVLRSAAPRPVLLHEEDPGAQALDPQELARTELAPVESDVVRTQPSGERDHVQHLRAVRRERQVDLAVGELDVDQRVLAPYATVRSRIRVSFGSGDRVTGDERESKAEKDGSHGWIRGLQRAAEW